ncbi:MAG: DNA repair protein RecN [Candidatus Melainabacteria bacterium RIFOXYA12_FULL_32_12]|nr:MAG: DNA repair protein RecN [Candidatus Melainabacteria bacterium RIFOXYA2_FULL_32_9]OGI31634.1 MAG: DNA repair protein RecN [Candidatus Melainabacteria bacterium RIFOXYA12_FULL_32_12]
MIKSLFINNFALIDELEVNFGKGLNILTGETGAGKSILIDAIDLVFGARSSKEQIKTGTNKALIELNVELSDNFPKNLLKENGIELEESNILIISREISNTGTRSRINGVLVTQNYIQSLREYLIDIHSQHETYNYIQLKTHITLLDSYGDKKHQELFEEFRKIYSEYKQTQKELALAKSQIQSKEQRIDFLKFQIDEISSAKIEDTNEYDNLLQERSVLINADELKNLSYSSYTSLYGQDNSIIDILNQIENKLIKASEFDKNLSRIIETLSSSSINLKDSADQLRNYSDNLETNPEQLTMIEERIDLLDKLKRKYGPDLANILDNLEKFEQELNEIEIKSEKAEELSKNLAILEKKLDKISQELSISRKNLAKLLSDLIQKELVKLEMPKVQFHIKVETKEEISITGIDNVEFLISPNPGEPLKPLAKIASGGEISRVMLAIKTIFAKADRVNTVIFDEIDSGISGKTSQAVAEELADLAKSHQILCITHQPIIAAMADKYFYIEKIQNENTTKIAVNSLDEKQRIIAISKLASGSQDQDSLNFAAKLIQQANEYKNNSKMLI